MQKRLLGLGFRQYEVREVFRDPVVFQQIKPTVYSLLVAVIVVDHLIHALKVASPFYHSKEY